jgi:radical SAM superfamily enzyme YgiQ (UPF0313 family)
MRIALLNFTPPQLDPGGAGTRWWHKSGSRWPASVLNRPTDGTEYFPWPFLLCYLKSGLEQDGHEVELVDACVRKWDTPQVQSYIAGLQPDYVVFETAEQTEELDRPVAGQLGQIAPVVLIGPNIAADRTDLLEWPGVYATVDGEYIKSARELLRAPHPGMTSRTELIGVAEMDALPFAYRDPELFSRYNARFKTTPPGVQGVFVSMWGCQYRCNFCIWVHSWWARSSQFQKHFSVERVDAEITAMRRAFPGVTSLYDDADNHDFRRPDAERFAEMMGRQGLPWAILTRADTFTTRSGDIDRDMWRAYRESGLYAVKIGVEGTQAAMDATNKRLDESKVREFIPFMQDLGISVYCSFMLGVPGTGPEVDKATMSMIKEVADYRPDLFEYFISYCDVTRVTPFFADNSTRRTLHDGQVIIEQLRREQGLPGGFGAVSPNNL